jgi:hypothetical protein
MALQDSLKLVAGVDRFGLIQRVVQEESGFLEFDDALRSDQFPYDVK